MLKSFGQMALLALSLVLFAAAPADAGQVRYPASASPAFSISAPDGWRTEDDGSNYQVFAPDQGGFIQLSMVAADDLATAKDDDLAALVFKAAGLPAFSRKQPVRIDGHTGTAYFASMEMQGKTVAVRVVLLRLDPTHLAVVTDARIGGSPTAPLDAVLATVRIVN